MSHFYLIRHAKADALAPSDKERRLAPKGEEDSAKLGALFSQDVPAPDIIICSDSARTRQTLSIMMSHGLSCGDIRYDEQLYHASASYIQDLMRQHKEANVMVIGHNPAMAIMLNHIATDDNLAPEFMHFPTGSFAWVELEDISPSCEISAKLKTFYKGALL